MAQWWRPWCQADLMTNMSDGQMGSVSLGSCSWNLRISFLFTCTKLLLFSLFFVSLFSFSFMGWSGRHLNFSAWIIFLVSLRWLRGCIAVSLSISVIGVECITPVIIHRAWFCTLSSSCSFVIAVVDHVVEPYSRWGLTVPWYTVLSIFSLAPQMVPAS